MLFGQPFPCIFSWFSEFFNFLFEVSHLPSKVLSGFRLVATAHLMGSPLTPSPGSWSRARALSNYSVCILVGGCVFLSCDQPRVTSCILIGAIGWWRVLVVGLGVHQLGQLDLCLLNGGQLGGYGLELRLVMRMVIWLASGCA